jgi:hypothetical protein
MVSCQSSALKWTLSPRDRANALEAIVLYFKALSISIRGTRPAQR